MVVIVILPPDESVWEAGPKTEGDDKTRSRVKLTDTSCHQTSTKGTLCSLNLHHTALFRLTLTIAENKRDVVDVRRYVGADEHGCGRELLRDELHIELTIP